MNRTLAVVTSRSDLRATLQRRPDADPQDVGLVTTMGALHEGHAALIRAARATSATVVVTIFVNPLQFGPAEDFGRYPRMLDDDLALCAAEGADIVFAPPAAEVFRGDQQVTVHPGALGEELEGRIRPGHFAGVLTVVHKLLHIVPAVQRAYFGEKDYQQLVLVRRMAHDLDLAANIVAVPTVREPDGLALSSRNRYLDPVQRVDAPAIPRALFAGAAAAANGATAAGVIDAARAVLAPAAGVSPDYLELRSPELGPAPSAGAARLLVAARIGNTRLIDNVHISLAPEKHQGR